MKNPFLFATPLAVLLACGLASPLLAQAQDAPSAATPVAAPSVPAEPTFDIWEYEIEGNTVLPVEVIERAVQPHLGPALAMRHVEAARAALEAAYQQAGYLTVLVDIPEQRVDSGVVQLTVLQGTLGHLYVTGSRFHSQGYIRQSLPALVPGSVPNFTDVQQQLATVNRGDDRRVAPVIKPGRLPGTVDMELQVTDTLPLSATLEINNQHAAGTTPLRASGTLRYDNLFQRDHALALTVQTAPEKTAESQVVLANYTIPLPEGDAWGLSFTHSNSNVATLGGVQALGKGNTLGLRRHHNVALGGLAGTFSVGADLKFLEDSVVFGSTATNPLRYLPFQVAYSGQWSEAGDSLQLNSSLTFALRRILQRNVNDDVTCPGDTRDQFSCKTQGASGSFGVFKLDGRWTTPTFGAGALTTRLALQMASGPLVSAEQYSLGGAETVRGYYEGETSADHALLGSFEWRGPNLAQLIGPGWTDVRPLLFVEAARGYLIEPATGQAARTPLWGRGLGLRATAAQLEASVDVAWPGKPTAHTQANDAHVHVRLLTRF